MKILRKARQVLFCSIALASLFTILIYTPTHAAATTSRAVVPNVASAACTKTDPEEIYTANQTHGSEVRQIQLWYSPSSRCAWAAEINGQADTLLGKERYASSHEQIILSPKEYRALYPREVSLAFFRPVE